MTLLRVPHGRLEAIVSAPTHRASGSPVALVCHPHPLYGGTMHTKVVHAVSKGLLAAGVASLRFNFRGVGLSSGDYDDGVGEREDATAALDHLARLYPDAPVLVAGFSFGAWVGLTMGALDPRVSGLIGLAPPFGRYDFSALQASAKPKLILQGEDDQLASTEVCERVYQELPAPKGLCLFERTGHLFLESLEGVRSIVETSIAHWPPAGQRLRLQPDDPEARG